MLEEILKGGYMMIPLMVCSVLTVAVVIDRALAFYRNAKTDSRALRGKVLELLGSGKIKEAALLCAHTPGPVSAVILAGLQSYSRHESIQTKSDSITTVVEKSMEDYSQHAISAVEKRLNILSSIGNVAPLMGMAGTVLGMISAFDALKEAGGVDAGLVAGGISEALVTTAAGLVIAIAAVIPYSYFNSMANHIALEIEEANSELIDFVATSAGLGKKTSSND